MQSECDINQQSLQTGKVETLVEVGKMAKVFQVPSFSSATFIIQKVDQEYQVTKLALPDNRQEV